MFNVEFIKDAVDNLVNFMRHHYAWSGIITFLIALLESLPIFGYLLPGSVILAGIGVLIGAKILPPVEITLWAIAGAIVGDGLSYWFGRRYHASIRNFPLLHRRQELFTHGEIFFKKHGGKSVFLGRFFGPLRPIIPVIAGMLHMTPRYFLIANVTSAVLWAPVHLLPGVVLGAATAAYSPQRVIHFIVFSLVTIVIFWFVGTVMRIIMMNVLYGLNRLTQPMANRLNYRPYWPKLQPIFHPHQQKPDYFQLTIIIGFLLYSLLFIILACSAIHGGFITYFNDEVREFFIHWQEQRWLQHVAVVLTFLGDRRLLLGLMAVAMWYFIYKRSWYTVLGIGLVGVMSVGSIYVLKHLLAVVRPDNGYMAMSFGSFPSGHTTLGTVSYGLMAMLARTQLGPDARWYLYRFMILILVGIIWSRLFLNAHWLSDVLGSLPLAGALLLAGLFYFHRLEAPAFSARQFISIMGIAWLLGWGSLVSDYYYHWTQQPKPCRDLFLNVPHQCTQSMSEAAG